MKKDKKNYLKISSPKVNKLFLGLSSTMLAIALVTLVLCIVGLISMYSSEEGMDIPSLFKGYMPFLEGALGVSLVLFMASLSVVIYNYYLNRDLDKKLEREIKEESPLHNVSEEQTKQIIDMLKSVAKPSSQKQHLNRAPTAQFLRALTELGYLDANVSGSNLKAWVENVTGYTDKDKDSGHFYSAYNNSTKEDSKVRKYMEQIEQILAQ